jgi:Methyltransferase FkbM domain
LYLSNAANLIRNKKLFRGPHRRRPAKLRELERNYSGNAQATTLGKMVGYSGSDTLDAILAPTAVPKDFDFLSIDIDGNDYHVWQAVSRYRPKLVCIEFNPTIPTEVAFIQERRAGLKQGSSLLALTNLPERQAMSWRACCR